MGRPRVSVVIVLMVCTLFFIVNRGAYKGFFQDDELDNIVNSRSLSPAGWARELVSPRLASENFRPAGHVYFALVDHFVKLDFVKYVVVLHLLHLLNGLLLLFLLRKLGIGSVASVAGFAFFLLSAAAFDAYWKPMYIFDVVCTTFCLATLVLYANGRWILAIGAMWLAYKAKELAVMLPLVLLAFEWSFGQRRWKRLLPFFAISVLFGVQALIANHGRQDDYSIVFTVQSLIKATQFYSSRLLLIPFAGLLFLLLPLVFRDRRMRLGAAMLALFFLPLMFLPGRVFGAYCYLPMIGVAVEIATLASLVPPLWTLALFAIWLPWNIQAGRADRRVTLGRDNDIRIYVNGLLEYVRSHPQLPPLAFSRLPTEFHFWGAQAALNYLRPEHSDKVEFMDEAHGRALPASARVTFLNWDDRKKKLYVIESDAQGYLTMGAATPVRQLGNGWFGLDDYFRWIAPHATATLSRPPDAAAFAVTVNVSPVLIRKYGHTVLRVSLNGTAAGSKQFDQPGIQTERWSIPPGNEPNVNVEFDVEPSAVFPPDPTVLGVAIVAFGFVASQ